MSFIGAGRVTDAALDAVTRTTFDVLHQLAERLRTLLATRGVCRDVGVRGQVEHMRKPTFNHTCTCYIYAFIQQCKKLLSTSITSDVASSQKKKISGGAANGGVTKDFWFLLMSLGSNQARETSRARR